MLSPGLLVASLSEKFVPIIYVFACHWIFPYLHNTAPTYIDVSLYIVSSLREAPMVSLPWVLVNLVYCATITPLIIMRIRLMVQKNHRREGAFTDNEEIVDSSIAVYASPEENVIR